VKDLFGDEIKQPEQKPAAPPPPKIVVKHPTSSLSAAPERPYVIVKCGKYTATLLYK
jgi:hypothetical protein